MPQYVWLPERAGGVNLFDDPSSIRDDQLVQCDNYVPHGRRWKTIQGNRAHTTQTTTARYRHLVEYQHDNGAGGSDKYLLAMLSDGTIQNITTGALVPLTGPALTSGETVLWDTAVFQGILLMANGNDFLMETGDGATYSATTGIANGGWQFVEAWKNRVFLAGRASEPLKVTYSADGDRHTYTGADAGFEIVTSPLGDRITAIRSVENYLAIFTSRTITLLIGDHPDNWTKRTIFEDHGCIAHRTIARAFGGLLYANDFGIWFLDPSGRRYELSRDIRPLWQVSCVGFPPCEGGPGGTGDTGPVVFDAASSSTIGAFGATFNWSHTVGNGQNRVLVVGFYSDSGTVSVDGITYGSQALSPILRNQGTFHQDQVWLWGLVNPDMGTHTITVTLDSDPGQIVAAGAVSFFDASQNAVFWRTTACASGSSDTPSVSVDSGDGDIVFDTTMGQAGDGDKIPAAGQTDRWDLSHADGGTAASTKAGADGPVVMSWTYPGSGTWNTVALSVMGLPVTVTPEDHREGSRGRFLHAVYEPLPNQHRYILWFAMDGSTKEDRAAIYHFNQEAWSFMVDFMDTGQTCQASCLREDPDGKINTYFSGGGDDITTNDKRVFRIAEIDTAFASRVDGNIAAALTTGILHGAYNPGMQQHDLMAVKEWNDLYLKYTDDPPSGNLHLGFSVYHRGAVVVQRTATVPYLGTGNITRERVGIGNRGWGIQVQVNRTGQDAHDVIGGLIDFDQKGTM